MKLNELKSYFPENVYSLLEKKGFEDLRPSQFKSVKAGLFEDKNLLVCTPTASGKTLVGELSLLNSVLNKRKKGVYIVPLRSLASEKYEYFKEAYPELRIGIGSGDVDAVDKYLELCDVIIVTSEKLDSLIRHRVPWLEDISTLVVDEIHLLNDVNRGPTLEVVITIILENFKQAQLIGLSATIGNPFELAKWLNADLIEDGWRPVKLKKGILFGNELDLNE